MTRRAILLTLSALIALPVLLAQQTGARKAPAAEADLPKADSAGNVSFNREVYGYRGEGRRDPFASLIASGDLRPVFSDLIVTGIIYDASGRNSMAMLKDRSTNELYRARVGSVYNRIRITGIRPREVQLAIDEFGFTRQETLTLNAPSPAERTP